MHLRSALTGTKQWIINQFRIIHKEGERCSILGVVLHSPSKNYMCQFLKLVLSWVNLRYSTLMQYIRLLNQIQTHSCIELSSKNIKHYLSFIGQCNHMFGFNWRNECNAPKALYLSFILSYSIPGLHNQNCTLLS